MSNQPTADQMHVLSRTRSFHLCMLDAFSSSKLDSMEKAGDCMTYTVEIEQQAFLENEIASSCVAAMACCCACSSVCSDW